MQHNSVGRLLLALTVLSLAGQRIGSGYNPSVGSAQCTENKSAGSGILVLRTGTDEPVFHSHQRTLVEGDLAFEDSEFANVTIEGKIYTARMVNLMARDHPTGFFVNPYLKARSLTYNDEIGMGPGNGTARDEIKVKSIGFGLTVGYQWVSRRGFVVELFHGFGGFLVNNIRHTMRYSTVVSGPNDYLKIDFRSGLA